MNTRTIKSDKLDTKTSTCKLGLIKSATINHPPPIKWQTIIIRDTNNYFHSISSKVRNMKVFRNTAVKSDLQSSLSLSLSLPKISISNQSEDKSDKRSIPKRTKYTSLNDKSPTQWIIYSIDTRRYHVPSESPVRERIFVWNREVIAEMDSHQPTP